jgi:hypothetical protein
LKFFAVHYDADNDKGSAGWRKFQNEKKNKKTLHKCKNDGNCIGEKDINPYD